MRLALAPKVAEVEGDTAVAEADRVVDKAETEVDEGAADEDQRQTEASNHRHSTYITLVVKISPNSEAPLLQEVRPLTIRRSLASLRLNLWDKKQRKKAKFDTVKKMNDPAASNVVSIGIFLSPQGAGN
jgi:hypothetical protein